MRRSAVRPTRPVLQSVETARALSEIMMRPTRQRPLYICPTCDVPVPFDVDYDRAIAEHLDFHFHENRIKKAALARAAVAAAAPPRAPTINMNDADPNECCAICLECFGTPTHDDETEEWVYMNCVEDATYGRVHVDCRDVSSGVDGI